MKEINVVIIGGIHHNTLGVIRSLGEHKIAPNNLIVLLVASEYKKNNIVSSSRYVNKKNIYYVNALSEVVSWLKELARDGLKRVIICCSDGASEEVINNFPELSHYYRLPNTAINISLLMDKEKQSELAQASGLHVPAGKAIDINSGISFQWDLFPCIIKPIKSVVGAGKNDIRISRDKEEFLDSIKKTEARRVQVQELLEKDFEYQLIGCSLNSGETIIIPGFTKIIRQPSNTNTGYLEYIPIKELDYDSQSVFSFIRLIGYSGLFSVEFIRDKNKNDYFLEINLRNDGNAYCVNCAGVNLPFIWCYYETFGELPKATLSINKAIKFIPDFNDLRVALHSIGLLKWLRDFFGAQAHSIFNWKDIKPFFVEIKRVLNRVSHKSKE